MSLCNLSILVKWYIYSDYDLFTIYIGMIGLFVNIHCDSLWTVYPSFFFRYPQTTKLYFKRSLPYVYWARGNFKGALQAFVDLYKGPSATGIYSNKPVIYVTWLLTTFPELSVIVKISCYAKSCLTDKTEKSACLSLYF